MRSAYMSNTDLPNTDLSNTDLFDSNDINSEQALPATRIAIIGAGLTGLITATLLERKFAQMGRALAIDIFEKSAGVGRLATRYKQPNVNQAGGQDNTPAKQYQFEFGAQFFTAKSTDFQAFIAPWIESGMVSAWQASVAKAERVSDDVAITQTALPTTPIEPWSDDQPRYISSPKMTSWGRALAKDLTQTTLHYKTRVAPLTDANLRGDNSSQTELFATEGKSLGRFDWVICTAPSVQASELLANSSFVYNQQIAQAKMLACYTLMLGWQAESKLPKGIAAKAWDVLEVGESKEGQLSSISRVFIEHHKPQRDHVLPSVTIHASNEWSQAHVDDELETVQAVLLADAQRVLGWDKLSAPDYVDCHRWRYAATANTTDKGRMSGVLVDDTKQWLVSGDWCAEGRIESCYQMGVASVNAILNKSII